MAPPLHGMRYEPVIEYDTPGCNQGPDQSGQDIYPVTKQVTNHPWDLQPV